MKIFITDETNITADGRPFDFFVYGGIVLTGQEMLGLSQQMLELKRRNNIPVQRPIKWNNRDWDCDDGLQDKFDANLHRELKNSVLEMFTRTEGKVIVVFSPQTFYYEWRILPAFGRRISRAKLLRTHKFAMNDCLGKFELLLSEADEPGIVLHDSFSEDMSPHMSSHCFLCFSGGRFPHVVGPPLPVDDTHSQVHQVNDVVIGAVSASLQEGAFNALPILRERFWSDGPAGRVLGRGISVYPLIQATPAIEQKVTEVKQKINRLLTKDVV